MAILASIEVDDQGTLKIANFKDALSSLGASVKKDVGGVIPEEGKKATNALDSLGRSAVALGTAMATVFGGNKIRAYLENAFAVASRNQVLSTVINAISKNARESATALEVQVQKIRELGITTSKARDSVVQFAQAQLKIADTAKVARAAQDLAVVAGTDSSAAFDRLTTAIQIQQPLLLRQFGVITGLEKIYGDYAKTVNKNVKELTEFEKKQAFVNAILNQAKTVQGAYLASMNDVGKQIGSLNRLYEESAQALGQALLPAMLVVIENLSKFLTWFAALDPATLRWVTGLAAAAAAMLSFVGVVKTAVFMLPALQALFAGMLGPLGILALLVGGVAAAFFGFSSSVGEASRSASESFAKIQAGIEGLQEAGKKVTDARKEVDKLKEANDGTSFGQQKLTEATQRYERALNDLAKKYPEVGAEVLKAKGNQDVLNTAIERTIELREKEQQALGRVAVAEANTLRARAKELREERDKLLDGQKEGAARLGPGSLGSLLPMTTQLKLAFAGILGSPEEIKEQVQEAGDAAVGAVSAELMKVEELLKQAESRARQMNPYTSMLDVENLLKGFIELEGGLDKLSAKANSLKVPGLGDLVKDITDMSGSFDVNLQGVEKLRSRMNNFIADLVAADDKATAEAQKNAEKYKQAYTSALDAIQGDAIATRAQLQAANDGLKQVTVGSDEWIQRLERAKSSIEKVGGPAKLLKDGLKAAAEGLEALMLVDALKFEQEWRNAFFEIADSAEKALGEIGTKLQDTFGEEAFQGRRKGVDAVRSANEEIRTLDEQLFERMVVSKMREVDQAIYQERKKVEDLRRSFAEQKRLRDQAVADEEAAMERRVAASKAEVLQVVAAERLKFQARAEGFRAVIALETTNDAALRQRQLAVVQMYEDTLGQRLDKFQENAEREIEVAAESGRRTIEARRQTNSELDRLQQEALDRQVAGSQIASAKLKDHFDVVKSGIREVGASLLDSITTGLLSITDGAKSFKETFIGIWRSIQQSVIGMINNIVRNWLEGILKMKAGGAGLSNFLGLGGKVPAAGQGLPGAMGAMTGPGQYGASGMSAGVAGGLTGGAVGGMVGFGVGSGTRSRGWGMLAGAGSGAAIGGMMGGPLGAGIGAGIGALGGLLGGIVGRRREWQEVKTARAELEASFGSWEKLQKKMQEVGRDVSELWNIKDMKTWEKTVKDLQKAFEEADKAAALKKAKESLPQVGTGMDDLRRKAALLKFDLGRLYDATNVEDFTKAQEELNELLDKQAKKMAAIGSFVEGLQKRTAGFIQGIGRDMKSMFDSLTDEQRKTFEGSFELAKKRGFAGSELNFLKETPGTGLLDAKQEEALKRSIEKAQVEFTRLGKYAATAFATIIRETGDVVQAMEAVAPTLDAMIEAQRDLGLEADASFEKLLQFRRTLKDNEDIANSLAGITQMIRGLGDAGLLTAGQLNAFGADAAAQWEEMAKRGVAADQALMVMQPTLQALYEAQKNYGLAVDETTQNLINMGVENGVVGDQFQSVSQKMLDILVLIADALGADIPAAYQRAGGAAELSAEQQAAAAQEAANAAELAAAQQAAAAEEAVRAAQEAALALGHVGTEIGGMVSEFDTAKSAVGAFADFAVSELGRVEDGVNAISFGHSPGGIKEIPVQSQIAKDAIRDFTEGASESLDKLYQSLDVIRDVMSGLDDQIQEELLEGVDLTLFRLAKDRAKMAADITEKLKGASPDDLQAALDKVNRLFDIRDQKAVAADRERADSARDREEPAPYSGPPRASLMLPIHGTTRTGMASLRNGASSEPTLLAEITLNMDGTAVTKQVIRLTPRVLRSLGVATGV